MYDDQVVASDRLHAFQPVDGVAIDIVCIYIWQVELLLTQRPRHCASIVQTANSFIWSQCRNKNTTANWLAKQRCGCSSQPFGIVIIAFYSIKLSSIELFSIEKSFPPDKIKFIRKKVLIKVVLFWMHLIRTVCLVCMCVLFLSKKKNNQNNK